MIFERLQAKRKRMNRVDNILQNAEYKARVSRIEELEADRKFCRHGMDHFLDVARIATLMAEDEGIKADREVIYAAALLHDIGRPEQYEDGTEHEIASAAVAPFILEECGYSEGEAEAVVTAIINHGNEAVKEEMNLTGLLYRADKASRKCFMCKAIDECHKSPDKRVMNIRY